MDTLSEPDPAGPRTAKEFFARSARSQDEWTRATHVISRMRADGVSLVQAARELEIEPGVVVRLAGSALRKQANGRYVAKPNDQLLRVMLVPTRKGPREVGLRSSSKASELGEYWASLHWYFETGDASRVKKFKEKYITDENGKRIPYLTDLDELDRLGSAGVFSFESLYASSA